MPNEGLTRTMTIQCSWSSFTLSIATTVATLRFFGRSAWQVCLAVRISKLLCREKQHRRQKILHQYRSHHADGGSTSSCYQYIDKSGQLMKLLLHVVPCDMLCRENSVKMHSVALRHFPRCHCDCETKLQSNVGQANRCMIGHVCLWGALGSVLQRQCQAYWTPTAALLWKGRQCKMIVAIYAALLLCCTYLYLHLLHKQCLAAMCLHMCCPCLLTVTPDLWHIPKPGCSQYFVQ